MGLLHQPNVTQWSHGDLVIHDADAKRADMLMIVIGRDASGVYRTRYAFPWAQPRPWRRKVWRNTVECLHDPELFGICVTRLFLRKLEPLQNGPQQDQNERNAAPSPDGEPVAVVDPDSAMQSNT